MGSIPTVEINGGPEGRRIVNLSELPEWEKKGYKRTDAAGASEPEATLENRQPYNFSVHTVEELREFATSANIGGDVAGMKKAQLIEALEKSDFTPQTQ